MFLCVKETAFGNDSLQEVNKITASSSYFLLGIEKIFEFINAFIFENKLISFNISSKNKYFSSNFLVTSFSIFE
jgi:hypothetical protein